MSYILQVRTHSATLVSMASNTEVEFFCLHILFAEEVMMGLICLGHVRDKCGQQVSDAKKSSQLIGSLLHSLYCFDFLTIWVNALLLRQCDPGSKP